MPLLKIQMTGDQPAETRNRIMSQGSALLAKITGKPEKYTMVVLENAEILMAGRPEPAAFIEVRGIGGLTPQVNKELSAALCNLLKGETGIQPCHVYLNFTDVSATHWGCDGSTFG